MHKPIHHRPFPATAPLAVACAAAALMGCVDVTQSPATGQAELATVAAPASVFTDADAVGGKALKLAPRTGAVVGFIPGNSPLKAIAVRLKLVGCPDNTSTRTVSVPYTLNFTASTSGSVPQTLGGTRRLYARNWTTVTVREGLDVIKQGNLDLRQLPHTDTTLPSTCAVAIDQGMLSAYPSPGFANASGTGKPRFLLRTNGETDAWMDNTSYNTWNAAHYHRAQVFRSHADQYLPWYNGGLVYIKSHAIFDNEQSSVPSTWLLRNSAGDLARVNYRDGNCNFCQLALDIGNADVRKYLVNRALTGVTGPNGKLFKGLWIDDVNMTLGLVSVSGNGNTPIDPRTNAPMTDANWQNYMAQLMVDIRAAVPATAEIYHNSKYYWGSPDQTTRQINAATGIHIEGGFTDDQLGVSGDPRFSVAALASYIAKVHAQGRNVIIDNFPDGDAARDYSLAGFHIFSAGADMIASSNGNAPTDWWLGHDMDLGAATTAVPTAPNPTGLWRRDFANGIALMVQPNGQAQTVTLPRAMYDTNGTVKTQVTLKPWQGAVLVNVPSGGSGPTNITKPKTFTF